MPKKPKHETAIRSAAAEYLTFVSTIGNQPGSVELRYEDENIWLTQRLMAELYGVSVPAISQHIKQIYSDNKLDEKTTIKNSASCKTNSTRATLAVSSNLNNP